MKLKTENGGFFVTSAEILSIKPAAEKIFLMEIKHEKISSLARPGQFVHIYCGGGTSIRRPFSIFSKTGDCIEIIFRVVGRGTEILSRKRKGDSVDLIAPLGNGFPVVCGRPLFVAGGLGVAPLHFLSLATAAGVFIYGTKRKNEIIPIESLKASGHKVVILCEETEGKKVTDIMEEYLNDCDVVFSAGPAKMMKKIAEICLKKKKKCFLSMEERMGCGIGLCRSCVVKTKTGYKRVCVDGPVFPAETVDWKDV
ncbi:MAG: dihydroorotate dehydrogenase electron transfer subunit [Elusimicrobia bacterium]|nr:dihydroorotate dehydrogenase electron transfer subunit [Elusimicrobiota bacterium]